MKAVIDRAEEEANILEQGGVDGIIVENFGDVPFRTGRLEPETIAGMTVAVERVEEVVKVPVGINMLCLLYTSPSPRDRTRSRMPSSA